MRDHLDRVGLHGRGISADLVILDESVGGLQQLVADAYRRAVTAELVGDLDNWRPTGIQAIWTPTTVVRGDWTAVTNAIRVDWTTAQVQLNQVAEGIRKVTAAFAKPTTCACGEPSDEFWEHSEEGCEFIPHQVELAHVE